MTKKDLIVAIIALNPATAGMHLDRLPMDALQSMLQMLKDVNIANEPKAKKTSTRDTFEYEVYPKHGYIRITSYTGRGKGKKGMSLRAKMLLSRLHRAAENCGTTVELSTGHTDKETGKPIYNLYKVGNPELTEKIVSTVNWTVTDEEYEARKQEIFAKAF